MQPGTVPTQSDTCQHSFMWPSLFVSESDDDDCYFLQDSMYEPTLGFLSSVHWPDFLSSCLPPRIYPFPKLVSHVSVPWYFLHSVWL